jgi:hypothetical protein
MNYRAIRPGHILAILALVLPVSCSKQAASDGSSGAQVDQAISSGQAPSERRHRSSFDELDKNKDGKVTPDEAGHAWKFLSKADTNGDGAVTKEEMDAFHPRKPSE